MVDQDAVLVVDEEAHEEENLLGTSTIHHPVQPLLQSTSYGANLVAPSPRQKVGALSTLMLLQGIDQRDTFQPIAWASLVFADGVVAEENAVLQIVECRVLLATPFLSQLQELKRKQICEANSRLLALPFPRALDESLDLVHRAPEMVQLCHQLVLNSFGTIRNGPLQILLVGLNTEFALSVDEAEHTYHSQHEEEKTQNDQDNLEEL
mmetsp:Transcript_4180/g.15666  ORF Transcript_4180/g.15666 Transcript_4180/m.15666 type:complete len:208 (+) Transcript_4180:561-1184(+)